MEANNPLWWLPLLAAVAVTLMLWRQRRGWGRPLLFAWGFFCVALLPVLGFSDVYFMKYSLVADHYQHIAMVAVIALAAAGWSVWYQQSRAASHAAAMIAGVMVVGALALLTWRQNDIYRDEISLYNDTLQKNPDCWMAHINLGQVLTDCGRVDEALAHCQRAVEVAPDNPEAHNDLGFVLAGRGQVDQAIAHYQRALEIESDYADAHYNLGIVLAGRGQFEEAISHYQKALEIKPDYAQAHNNLGLVLAGRGRFEEAIAHYQKALEIKPDFVEAYYNLGTVLAGREQFDAATAHYQKALEIKPDYAEAHYNLGVVLAGRGEFDAAVAHYQKVLQIKPDYAQAHNNLGIVLADRGQFDEAIDHFRKAVEIKADYTDARDNLGVAQSRREGILKLLAEAHESLRSHPDDLALLNDIAWMLATNPNASIRNGTEAVELAQRAVRLSDKREPAIFGTLAAAYAEAGRFSEAVPTAERARALASSQNNTSLADALRARIKLYQAGSPYRDIQHASAPTSVRP